MGVGISGGCVTSIRQRYSQASGAEPGHGRAEAARWPRLRDVRPLLIRSAGVVGIAGIIIGVISSGALVGEETAVESTAVDLTAAEPAAPAGQTTLSAGEVGPGISIFAAPAASGALPGFARHVGAAQVAEAEPAAESAPPQAASPIAVASLPANAEPSSGAAEAAIEAATVIEAPEVAPVAIPLAEPATVAAAQEPALPIVEELAAIDEAQGDADIETAWTDDAVACPRDWVAPEGADARAPSPAGCRALAALLPGEASTAEQAALSEAAAEHAETLALLEPRLPIRRPDPPPRARYRSAPGGALPAPPDCGSKHAYWRYIDRKLKIREWHCK
jgi:hypothetical protein